MTHQFEISIFSITIQSIKSRKRLPFTFQNGFFFWLFISQSVVVGACRLRNAARAVPGAIDVACIQPLLDCEQCQAIALQACLAGRKSNVLARCFGVPATARASFALYNTESDVDALVRGLHRVREVFDR